MTQAAAPPVEEKWASLDAEERALWLEDDPLAVQGWIEKYLTVPDTHAQIVSFKLFPQQVLMLQNATGRDITVKGRQTRASTLLLARRTRRVCTSFGLKCLVAANDDQTTSQFRWLIKHWFEDLERAGFVFKQGGKFALDNDDELLLGDNESRFIWQSGEQRIVGRAFTAHDAHISELAHWKQVKAGELLGGLIPAVPGSPFGQIDFESTPKGAEGQFYDAVMDSKVYKPDATWSTWFYPWHIEPRYRMGTDPDADMMITEEEFEQRLRMFKPTKDEQKLMAEANLDASRILWRRARSADLARTGVPFQQEYPETLEGCFIGVAGNFFMALDGMDHLSYYRNMTRDPVMLFEKLPYNGAEVDLQGPSFSIWEFPDPQSLYVVFVDCASGETGPQTDFTAITVMDARRKTLVARLRVKVTPTEAGTMACAIGSFYNLALLGVESGGYGSSCLQQIRNLAYPNVFYHVDPSNPRSEPKPGIYPTELNRNEILQALRTEVFSHRFVTYDRLMVQEMSTFDWVKVRDRKKAMARTKTTHDDLVMSVAGCCYIAPTALNLRRKGKDDQEEVVVGQFGQVIRRNTSSGQKHWFR